MFVSSHLMSEMQLTADHLVVIGRGRLLADARVGDFITANTRTTVSVRVPDPGDRARLERRLREQGTFAIAGETDELIVDGSSVTGVGDLAHSLGIRLHGLREQTASLEQAYMELTASSVEYGVSA